MNSMCLIKFLLVSISILRQSSLHLLLNFSDSKKFTAMLQNGIKWKWVVIKYLNNTIHCSMRKNRVAEFKTKSFPDCPSDIFPHSRNAKRTLKLNDKTSICFNSNKWIHGIASNTSSLDFSLFSHRRFGPFSFFFSHSFPMCHRIWHSQIGKRWLLSE